MAGSLCKQLVQTERLGRLSFPLLPRLLMAITEVMVLPFPATPERSQLVFDFALKRIKE